MKMLRVFMVPVLALVILCGVPFASNAAALDPQADQILRQMSNHLSGLKTFSIEAVASTDVVYSDGRKIQYVSTGSGVFDRERGFRIRRQGSTGDVEFVFDGSTLTLHAPMLNGYHSIPVNGGNDNALDEARATLGIEAAGGVDLLYADPYPGLNLEVESSEYIGEEIVGGIRAHHLAYRAAEIDWQIWIQADGPPLPLRYIITSKWITAAPQFMVQVSRWETDATVSDIVFQFIPPDGSKELGVADLEPLGISVSE